MSAAQHTPGPWHWPHDSNTLAPVNPDPRRSAVHSILDADGGYGFLGKPNREVLAELEADRRLIAAAPDLLAHLERCAEALAHCMGNEYAPVLEARAAIAKATGGAA